MVNGDFLALNLLPLLDSHLSPLAIFRCIHKPILFAVQDDRRDPTSPYRLHHLHIILHYQLHNGYCDSDLKSTVNRNNSGASSQCWASARDPTNENAQGGEEGVHKAGFELGKSFPSFSSFPFHAQFRYHFNPCENRVDFDLIRWWGCISVRRDVGERCESLDDFESPPSVTNRHG